MIAELEPCLNFTVKIKAAPSPNVGYNGEK